MAPDLQNIINKRPKAIIICSGKRKSGKDYVSSLLSQKLGVMSSVIIRLSGPLKERYAIENNLDYTELLEASEYKEIYRERMIKFGEDIRSRDPGYFCHHAIAQSDAYSKKVWIVSDARRTTDIEYFISNFNNVVVTIRIEASDAVRQQRGWKFTKGVDDAESECGLDDYCNWNFLIQNNKNEDLLKYVEQIVSTITKLCEP